jgi:hypothetical protein
MVVEEVLRRQSIFLPFHQVVDPKYCNVKRVYPFYQKRTIKTVCLHLTSVMVSSKWDILFRTGAQMDLAVEPHPQMASPCC